MKKNHNNHLLAAFICCIALVAAPAQAGWFDWWKSDYTKTKYPIVLAHGFMGFDSMLLLIDYWPGVVDELEDDGATVFVTVVSTVNSSEERGEQLLAQIEEILAITGADKVNIMGHSQGSLDARYVAAVRPELVASVTSIGGPHGIGELPDSLTGIDSDSFISVLLEGLGSLIAIMSGSDQPVDIEAAAVAFTPEGMEDFNASYPAGLPDSYCGEGANLEYINGQPVRFYSWGGTATSTNILDPTDLITIALGASVDGPSDGFVGRCINHLGSVIRDDYRMNHLDLANMMFGLSSWFEVDPKSVFRSQANRLKKAGL